MTRPWSVARARDHSRATEASHTAVEGKVLVSTRLKKRAAVCHSRPRTESLYTSVEGRVLVSTRRKDKAVVCRSSPRSLRATVSFHAAVEGRVLVSTRHKDKAAAISLKTALTAGPLSRPTRS